MEDVGDQTLTALTLEALEAQIEVLDSSVPSDEVTDFLIEHGVLSPITRSLSDGDYDSYKDDGGEGDHVARARGQGGAGYGRSADEGSAFPPQHRQEELPGGNATHTTSAAAAVVRPPVAEDKRELEATDDGGGDGESPDSKRASLSGKQRKGRWGGDDGNDDDGGGAGGGGGSGGGDPWVALNRVLSQEGYRPVVPGDPEAMIDRVMQVLQEHRDRGEQIKELVMERGRWEGHERRAAQEKMVGMERDRGSLNDSLLGAGVRVKELEEELESTKRTMADKIKEAKVKCSNLAAQLRHSEHRVKTKEAQVEQMLDKFQALKEKDKRAKEHERAVFKRLQQREPRPSDSKLLECVSALEGARQRTKEEVKALREEVRCLNEMVKERENYIMRKETGGTWRSRVDGSGGNQQEGLQHLADKCRELERQNRHASLREQSLLKKVEELEAQVDKARARAERLEEDNTNMVLELKSRPTVRAWRMSQKRIEDLEVKLAQATQEAREAMDVRELRKYMGVSELVKRDKANYRLKLERVDDLPREVVQDVVKECCRVLEVSDISEVVPSLDKMSRVLTTLPRLERFVKEVCSFVVGRTKGDYDADGRPIAPHEHVKRLTMEEVLSIIKEWWSEVQACKHIRSFRSRLVTRLSTRVATTEAPGGSGGGSHHQTSGPSPPSFNDDEEILDMVMELIQLERRLLQSRDMHAGAQSLLTDQPEVFLHRVVQHFQYLFQVKSVDGIFPKMNQLYLYTSEMDNFTRVLCSMLGLKPSTSTNALLTSLQAVVKPTNGSSSQEDGRVGGDEEPS